MNSNMIAKHTAGPWTIKHDAIVFAGERLVANAGSHSDRTIPTELENIANARLIAAAPELLAILKQLTETYAREYQTLTDGQFGEAPGVTEARAAIAKAEGRDK